MTVSIITATFNSAKTIESCLASIVSQTYKNIEIIIVDGKSGDSTISLVNSSLTDQKRIHVISEPDNGIYDALNKGIKLATGEIVGFLHSDDVFAEKAILQRVVNTFVTTDCDGVYGDLHYVQYDNPKKIVRYWKSKTYQPHLLTRGWMPAHPTLFLKRSVYQEIGSFNLNYRIAADYEFVLRLFSNRTYKFIYIPKTITKMRLGGESNKSYRNIIKKTKEDLRAARQNNLPFPLVTIAMKNVSKIPQWFKK